MSVDTGDVKGVQGILAVIYPVQSRSTCTPYGSGAETRLHPSTTFRGFKSKVPKVHPASAGASWGFVEARFRGKEAPRTGAEAREYKLKRWSPEAKVSE